VVRCATAGQFCGEALFSGATYPPPGAVERGWVHELVEERALLDRAIAAAHALAALPPQAFALSKRQTRQPALDRMKDPVLDAAIEKIWTAPETLPRIGDYVARHL